MQTTAHLDQLDQVQELNRTFVGFLQTRARAGRDCLGLPGTLHATLRAANAPLLDVAAAVPQALFRLDLAPQHWSSGAAPDADLHEVCSAILWGARYASRQSPYQASLLFRLSPQQIQHLRTLPVAELQRLAWSPHLLHCAFCEREWIWQWLFNATQPEALAQLTLVALQPGVDRDWPHRRAPHPVA